jgi:hypothetical protein
MYTIDIFGEGFTDPSQDVINHQLNYRFTNASAPKTSADAANCPLFKLKHLMLHLPMKSDAPKISSIPILITNQMSRTWESTPMGPQAQNPAMHIYRLFSQKSVERGRSQEWEDSLKLFENQIFNSTFDDVNAKGEKLLDSQPPPGATREPQPEHREEHSDRSSSLSDFLGKHSEDDVSAKRFVPTDEDENMQEQIQSNADFIAMLSNSLEDRKTLQ